MATVSPSSSVKKEGGGAVRYTSPTRMVADDDLTPPPRQTRSVIGMRLRADSNGSTNNAFFRDGHPPFPTNPIPVDPEVLARRKVKKKQKKLQQKQKKIDKYLSSMVEMEEGEMAAVTNRSTSKPYTASLSYAERKKKQEYWKRSSWETSNVGLIDEDTPAFIANRLAPTREVSKEFSEATGRSHSKNNLDKHHSSSRSDDLRVSEISMAESLLGTGLMDSSSRLSTKFNYDSMRSSTRSARKTRGPPPTKDKMNSDVCFTVSDDDGSEMSNSMMDDKDDKEPFDFNPTIMERIKCWLDPSPWLIADVQFDDNGTPYFDAAHAWTIAGFVRHYLYDPIAPEFTSLQQFLWAVIIGIAMGVYTALWKMLIEAGVDLVWETIPEFLLTLGVFTDLDGVFPLYHYMWICPMIFSAILSYIFCILPVPIPGQNEWIKNLHARGVQDYRTFWPLFILATLGMLSGLSLGPELPLVLTAGMFGSWLGIVCKQSMLQARVLNLTAASAAVGGFFGFPMAGALFVLEIPHRMGLQYFEALSPATISSIIAVLANRIITGNDVTGYFKYPFLSDSLPSQIFTHSIVYGLYGAAIGVVYTLSVLKLKGWVHDWFHKPHHHHEEPLAFDDDGSLDYHIKTADPETKPLVDKKPIKRRSSAFASVASFDSWSKWTKKACSMKRLKKIFCCVIPYEPYRAAVAGAFAGAACGLIAMFVPHTLFWGEAQLQNLIDKGRTPLPVFGQGDEPTTDLTAMGYCIIDPNDPDAIKAGFSMQCSIVLMVTKTIVIGLSLGTGIIGGHFWGPLFIGCAASHLLGDLVHVFESITGFGGTLAAYPCLVILCTMGSAHVVTFRAHTAIMLILTLTISAFTSEDNNFLSSIAGDYSAVFPLLVISCFVSLMTSRHVVFYKEQRSRGDITAVPEVLCEPGMQGRPLVSTYDPTEEEFDDDEDLDGFDDELADLPTTITASSPKTGSYRAVNAEITQDEIEQAFLAASNGAHGNYGSLGIGDTIDPYNSRASPIQKPEKTAMPNNNTGSAFSRLDELLSAPLDQPERRPSPTSMSAGSAKKKAHRRTQSAPAVDPRMRLSLKLERKDSAKRFESPTPDPSKVSRERTSSRSSVVRVDAFGELHEHQPPLLEQARLRAASRELIRKPEVRKEHRRSPSMPARSSPVLQASNSTLSGSSHDRRMSGSSHGRRSRTNSATGIPADDQFDFASALSLEEIEASFNEQVSAKMNPKNRY